MSKMQVKGNYEECNDSMCDECDLCYMQGTIGEHIESIETAIKAIKETLV